MGECLLSTTWSLRVRKNVLNDTSDRIIPMKNEHHEALALWLMRADLAYVHGAIIGRQTSFAWLFTQYSVLVAYEARKHLVTIGTTLPDAGWPQGVASAARMSGKYFDDSKRSLSHIFNHFEAMTSQNRDMFFPAGRLGGEEFDYLRTDLAVLLLDDTPVLTNITGYFAAGLPPDGPLDTDVIGPQIHRLAQGIGSTIGVLGVDTAHTGPLNADNERFRWQDADTRAALPELFAGEFDPHAATGLLAISTSAAATEILARSDCCVECHVAVLKHRLVVAYHAIRSLQILQRDMPLGPEAQQIVSAVLESSPARTLLSDGYRRLRNGLVHYGLTDVPLPSQLDEFSIGYLINHYTGADLGEVFRSVNDALATVSTVLTAWSTSIRPGGRGFRDTFQEPFDDDD